VLIGYEWIADTDSEAVQDDQRQALLQAGVVAAHIYSDVASAAAERPALAECLDTLQAGDMLMVWQLDRLVDSRAQLLRILQDLRQRNIALRVLAGQGAVLDTTRLDLRLVIDVIAALNDLETLILRRRTRKAQTEARARGQVLGPQRKMNATLLQQAVTALIESDLSMTAIAENLGFTRATLYNYVNGDGSLKPAGRKLLEQAQERVTESPDA
jgi:DNA invertase Pin-like site-specific DNA recombinase